MFFIASLALGAGLPLNAQHAGSSDHPFNLLDSLSISILAEWGIPTNEFGSYWNPGPRAGFALQRRITDPVALEGAVTAAFFQASETPLKHRIPDVFLVSFSVGIRHRVRESRASWLTLGAHVSSHTFAFLNRLTGAHASNRTESEIGLTANVGVGIQISHNLVLEPYVKYEHHLTGPDPIGIFSLGVLFPLDVQ